MHRMAEIVEPSKKVGKLCFVHFIFSAQGRLAHPRPPRKRGLPIRDARTAFPTPIPRNCVSGLKTLRRGVGIHARGDSNPVNAISVLTGVRLLPLEERAHDRDSRDDERDAEENRADLPDEGHRGGGVVRRGLLKRGNSVRDGGRNVRRVTGRKRVRVLLGKSRGTNEAKRDRKGQSVRTDERNAFLNELFHFCCFFGVVAPT